ncbi:MAG: hypothetical protein QOE36_587 [Gaiellaceae bacterium]|nr:hypothetical protein [Gaiellaceae bacterium]
MSAPATTGPVATESEVVFAFPDAERAFQGVALVHELRRPRRVPFERRGAGWELTLQRPEADRMEYMLELTRADGSTELVPDPENPLRAPGPFGDKSVLEFPGYEPPAWVADDDAPPGDLRTLELPSRRLRTTVGGILWSPADTAPDLPLPLLVVHDGPEYAKYSGLLRLLDHLVSFGEVPLLRAALLEPAGDRNEAYSASARYAKALAVELLPALAEQAPQPEDWAPVAMGASLGALAALHAHWLYQRPFGGLFLQSGSFFRQRYDRHESGFPRFRRISRFVGQVLAREAAVQPFPITLTSAKAEENLDNNRAVAAALAAQGYDIRLVENRDAHNWIGWRDALHPHLADLLVRAWG